MVDGLTISDLLRRERFADRQIHYLGLTLGAMGVAAVILALNIVPHGRSSFPILIYCTGLLSMLSCSAAYNLARTSQWRALFRRYDHAAIFIMIAGTYTPFTVLCLNGAWSISITAIIWTVAILAATAKFFFPRRSERFSTSLYLALGWIGLVALKPLIAALDVETIVLLGAGAVLYTSGVVFHLWEKLPYQNAIWHSFVLAAACCHYVAVLHAVVLT